MPHSRHRKTWMFNLPDQDCMKKITDQQALTRKIRAINNPIGKNS